MKYVVVITRWSDEKKVQVKDVAGIFDKFYNARIFKDAYMKEFSTDASIVEVSDLVNAFYAE